MQDQKSAVKIHTILDYDEHLSAYVKITYDQTADSNGAYYIPLINYLGASPRGIIRKYLLNFDLEGRGIKPSGGIKEKGYCAGRFYNDFSLLYVRDSNGKHLVIRYKDNIQFETIKAQDLPENKHPQDFKSEVTGLTGNRTKKKHPQKSEGLP